MTQTVIPIFGFYRDERIQCGLTDIRTQLIRLVEEVI